MAINIYTPDSSKFIHKTEVDFIKRISQRIVHIVEQDDRLPIVEVNLYLNGEPYIIPSVMNGQINWSRKDQVSIKKIILGCNSTRTSIYFEIDKTMSFYSGKLNPILELNTGSGSTIKRVSSQSIPILID